MNTTRATLIHRLKSRSDDSAWACFYEIYFPLITGYARARGLHPDDIEDIASSCLQMIMEKIHHFEYGSQKGRFRCWLRRIVNNKVTDLQRRYEPQQGLEEQLDRAEDGGASPEDLWNQAWRDAHLQYCLRQLEQEISPRQFQAFHLYVIEDWSPDKVASVLGIPRNHVYVAKKRVLERLREAMDHREL